MIRYPRMKTILLVTVLIIFVGTGIPVQAFGQTSEMAQSFSQYFNPKVFRAVDAIMKERSCTPDGYWRISTYGFRKDFKKANGKNLEIILSWDGFYYRKGEFEPMGDWTLLK